MDNKQIILIILLSTFLGLARFSMMSDPKFTLIKQERIIKEIVTFSIPDIMSEPMAINIDFAKHLFDIKSAIFIDARDVEDYEAGHIENAINIPYDYYEDYEDIINSLNTDDIYIIYCSGEDCSLSMDLAEYLFYELLFEKVLVFEGGWPKWRSLEFPS